MFQVKYSDVAPTVHTDCENIEQFPYMHHISFFHPSLRRQ